MTIKINKDVITNLAGAVFAIAMAFQPIMDAMKGDITLADINKLILAASVAVLGYYSGKSPTGKKLPTREIP